MTEQRSAGLRFRQALEVEKPLQIIGTVNAYAAMMAKQVGYKAIYLSGAGVANYSYGLPDLGMTSLDNVLEDVRRITERVDTPLLVDIDTGWGGAFNISKTKKHKNAVATAQTKKSSPNKKWSTASKLQSMPKPMQTLW
jgi:methylisocitrate lyase